MKAKFTIYFFFLTLFSFSTFAEVVVSDCTDPNKLLIQLNQIISKNEVYIEPEQKIFADELAQFLNSNITPNYECLNYASQFEDGTNYSLRLNYDGNLYWTIIKMDQNEEVIEILFSKYPPKYQSGKAKIKNYQFDSSSRYSKLKVIDGAIQINNQFNTILVSVIFTTPLTFPENLPVKHSLFSHKFKITSFKTDRACGIHHYYGETKLGKKSFFIDLQDTKDSFCAGSTIDHDKKTTFTIREYTEANAGVPATIQTHTFEAEKLSEF